MAKRFSSFSGFPDQPVPESKKYTSGVHPEVKTCQQTPQSSPLDLWLLRSHLTLLLFKRDYKHTFLRIVYLDGVRDGCLLIFQGAAAFVSDKREC